MSDAFRAVSARGVDGDCERSGSGLAAARTARSAHGPWRLAQIYDRTTKAYFDSLGIPIDCGIINPPNRRIRIRTYLYRESG